MMAFTFSALVFTTRAAGLDSATRIAVARNEHKRRLATEIVDLSSFDTVEAGQRTGGYCGSASDPAFGRIGRG